MFDCSQTEDDYIHNEFYKILSKNHVFYNRKNTFKDVIFIYYIDEYKDIYEKRTRLILGWKY